MSIFEKLTNTGLEESKDTLGGSYILDTDIYEATVKQLYVTTSKAGAMGINLIADINGREYRETLYVTNKNGENFYKNKQTGNKVPLPGFVTVNDLCLCGVGKNLSELDAEDKVVQIWNSEQKAQVPTAVPTIVDMLGAKVGLAIQKEIVDKNVSDGAGGYVPSGETREQNSIAKVFHLESHKTVNEAKSGKETASFWDKWLDKNKGIVRNRATKTGREGRPGKPAGSTPARATTSLFAA